MVPFSTVKNVLAMPSEMFDLTSQRPLSIFLIRGCQEANRTELS